jgi:hypothetical protein
MFDVLPLWSVRRRKELQGDLSLCGRPIKSLYQYFSPKHECTQKTRSQSFLTCGKLCGWKSRTMYELVFLFFSSSTFPRLKITSGGIDKICCDLRIFLEHGLICHSLDVKSLQSSVGFATTNSFNAYYEFTTKTILIKIFSKCKWSLPKRPLGIWDNCCIRETNSLIMFGS